MPTGIDWTDETWNPIVGCTKVSPGCKNCYAEKKAAHPWLQRFSQYQQVVEFKKDEDTGEMVGSWNRTTLVVESAMDKPLRWKKPRMIFVCSMSDLFHESVSDHTIDRIFAVMAMCPQHTFQVLTKRPERMQKYLQERSVAPLTMATLEHDEPIIDLLGDCDNCIDNLITTDGNFDLPKHLGRPGSFSWQPPDIGEYGRVNIAGYWERNTPLDDILIPWPLRNVWIGTSVENQAAADERIPHLLQTPAAVRFLSVEPMLERIWFVCDQCCTGDRCPGPPECTRWNRSECPTCEGTGSSLKGIDWLILGAESKGPAAGRPCNIEWVRDIVQHYHTADTRVFIKQLHVDGKLVKTIADFPEDLRIREFPA